MSAGDYPKQGIGEAGQTFDLFHLRENQNEKALHSAIKRAPYDRWSAMNALSRLGNDELF